MTRTEIQSAGQRRVAPGTLKRPAVFGPSGPERKEPAGRRRNVASVIVLGPVLAGAVLVCIVLR